jgi:hypothetical protein
VVKFVKVIKTVYVAVKGVNNMLLREIYERVEKGESVESIKAEINNSSCASKVDTPMHDSIKFLREL